MNITDPVAALCGYHGESDPEQLILKLCRELTSQCPTEAGPAPLLVLASCQGVRRIHREPIRPETGCSGFLVPSDGGYETTVNSAEPSERQNFSIAHEIIHTFFRDACSCSTATEREEQLCDLGAAELTMPADRFAAHLARAGLSLAAIDSAKAEFAVSFEAAGRRAVTLTPESACLFIAALGRTLKQERTNTGEPVLRVVRWRASPSWPNPRGYRNRPVEPASLIGQAFAHQDERRGRARLGLPFDPATYQLEARGYGYPRAWQSHLPPGGELGAGSGHRDGSLTRPPKSRWRTPGSDQDHVPATGRAVREDDLQRCRSARGPETQRSGERNGLDRDSIVAYRAIHSDTRRSRK